MMTDTIAPKRTSSSRFIENVVEAINVNVKKHC